MQTASFSGKDSFLNPLFIQSTTKILQGIKLLFVVVIVLVTASSYHAQTNHWMVNGEQYSVKFKGGKVAGELRGLKALLNFDPAQPDKSKLSALIETESLSTGSTLKNTHAKAENALNSKTFPVISFESTHIQKTNTGFEAQGNLTIKGITHMVTIAFTFESLGNAGTFKGQFNIHPKDYHITRFGSPDNVEITLTIHVTR